MTSFFRYSEPVTFAEAAALCIDEDSGCSFPDPFGAFQFYQACVEADIPLPDEVFRVDAQVTAENPGVWITASGEVTTEGVGTFNAATCDVGTGPGEEPVMTCGVNLSEQEFTCLTPDEPVRALLGAPSEPDVPPPPEGSCPEDGGVWTYINEDLCVQ